MCRDVRGHALKQGWECVCVCVPGVHIGFVCTETGFRNMWGMSVHQRSTCPFVCVISDVEGCPWGLL